MKKSNLRATAALQALAFLGAGIPAAFIAATPAHAQDYTNVTATGRVVDAAGNGIAGATVAITSNEQGFTRTTTTDASGGYTVPQLPQGSYTFAITAPGQAAFTDPNVRLALGNAGNQFQLGRAEVTNEAGNTIVVTGRRTRATDFAETTTGAVIDIGELATRVPVARDITSVVLLSPGTAQGDTAFGNLPTIAGSSVSENTYYINGLNITNIRSGLGAVTVPFDFYQTVEVKNGGYSAEFGRATGGFINAVTKSGGNTLHGGVTFNWEPDGLSKDSPNTIGSDNDSSFFDRKDVVAQLSGPIIKDRLFAYGLYQWRDVHSEGGSTSAVSNIDPRISTVTGLPLATQPSSTVQAYSCFINPQYCYVANNLPSNLPTTPTGTNTLQQFAIAGTGYTVTRNRSPFYGIKLDAIPIDGHRVEFTLFDTTSKSNQSFFGTNAFSLASGCRYNPNTNYRGCALPAERGGTSISTAGGVNHVTRYTGNFTDWLTLSAAYGRNKNNSSTVSSGRDAPGITDTRFGVSIPLGNPVGSESITKDTRDFYRADADVRVNFYGAHHFRGGYDRENLKASSAFFRNGNYDYTVSRTTNATICTISPCPAGSPEGDYVGRRYFRNGGDFKTQTEAYYLEDSWKLFGDRLTLNLGVRNDRFTNENNEGNAFFESGDNWAPRLGFAFDVFGDRKTKLYGAYGRYFLGIPLNTNTRLAGRELDYTQYYRISGLDPATNIPVLTTPLNNNGPLGTRPCPAGVIDTFNGGTANCTINQDGSQPPYKTLVAKNLAAQQVNEILLGVEHRLPNRWKVGAYVSRRKLIRSLEDAYIDKGVQAYCTRTFAAASTDLADCLSIFTGAHQYSLINPGSDVQVALNAPGTSFDGRTVTLSAADLGLPKAKRLYKALTLTVDREFDGKWAVGGSYTLSSLKGNIEGGVKSDNGQTDSGLTTSFDFPALQNGAYGYLPGHRKHNIKLYGNYQPFNWLNLGANLSVISPRKFGCIGRTPNYVDPVAGAGYGASAFYCNVDASGNVILLNNANGFVFSNPSCGFTPCATNAGNTLSLTPRGSKLKSDWLTTLNVDVGVKLPVETFDATLRASVFNILNRKGVNDLNEVGTNGSPGSPSAQYGQPVSYQAPRSVRLQLGVAF